MNVLKNWKTEQLTIMKTYGRAIKRLAMANALTLALTKKAMLTAARLVRLRDKTCRKKDSASYLRPGGGQKEKKLHGTLQTLSLGMGNLWSSRNCWDYSSHHSWSLWLGLIRVGSPRALGGPQVPHHCPSSFSASIPASIRVLLSGLWLVVSLRKFPAWGNGFVSYFGQIFMCYWLQGWHSQENKKA